MKKRFQHKQSKTKIKTRNNIFEISTLENWKTRAKKGKQACIMRVTKNCLDNYKLLKQNKLKQRSYTIRK